MKYSVIGAGHGGQGLAAYLAYNGYDTMLYNRTESVIQSIRDNQGITLEGIIVAKVEHIGLTSILEEAVQFADIIIISIPANEHENLAVQMVPYIRNNQKIILIPGRCLGAYYFEKVLREQGCKKEIIVAETDTFILTSRKVSDGMSQILSLKKQVYIASKNQEATEEVGKLLVEPFPMMQYTKSSVYTSLNNIGAIFHPIPALLNIGRIEKGHQYTHYQQGISPSIAHLMQKLDDERIEIGRRLGETLPTAKQWLEDVYGSKGDTLYEALQATTQYNSVCAPTEISTRYIYEDITTGIVPLYCLAETLGIKHTVAKLIIELATQLLEYDFMENGRSEVELYIKDSKIFI